MRKFFNFSKAAFWVGLIIVVYMFAILTSETGKNYNLRSHSDELEEEINQLQSQIEELGFQIQYYKTDVYKEKLAREKLGLQKPGETVVIVPKSETQLNPTVQSTRLYTTTETQPTKSHWQQWRDFLFGS